MTIQDKFDTISSEDGLLYVKAKPIANMYSSMPKKSGTTQKKLVKELQVHSFMITWDRHKDKSKKGTIATKLMSQFKSQVHTMYISVHDLDTPKDGPNKDNHIQLLQLIDALPDINQNNITVRDQENTEQPQVTPAAAPIVESIDEAIQVTPAAAPIMGVSKIPGVLSGHPKSNTNDNCILMPIIELKEHEMFRDAEGNIFPIEVRGERSKDKILFKAKDVSVFADNERLIQILTRDDSRYQYGTDYHVLKANDDELYMKQILPKNSIPLVAGSNSPIDESIPLLVGLNSPIDESIALLVQSNSSVNEHKINWDYVYLTLAGLIRVVYVSRNANANLVKLFDWFAHLFYVHQFGSHEERNELAQSLFKQVLNDKLAGLYNIDLGTFNDLYDSMNISRETYPPEKYGSYHLYKFGLSKDISARLTQHQNKTSGYGRWSKHVLLKWVILIPDSKLSAAETMLSEKLNSAKLSFEYTDCDGKNHTELFAIDPTKHEAKVKGIYKQIISHYPTKENHICDLINSLQTTHDLAISELHREYEKKLNSHDKKLSDVNESKLKLIIEYEKKLSDVNESKLKAEHKAELIGSESKVEILQMQLKLAKAGLL